MLTPDGETLTMQNARQHLLAGAPMREPEHVQSPLGADEIMLGIAAGIFTPSTVCQCSGGRHTRTRIYVAGPMSGLPGLNFEAFHERAAQLRAAGYHVENPAENPAPPGDRYADYLRMAIAQLLTCDEIHLLPGWERSRGACLEVQIARTLELRVVEPQTETTCLQK